MVRPIEAVQARVQPFGGDMFCPLALDGASNNRRKIVENRLGNLLGALLGRKKT